MWLKSLPLFFFFNNLGNTWLAVAANLLHGGGSVWQPLSYGEMNITAESVFLTHLLLKNIYVIS